MSLPISRRSLIAGAGAAVAVGGVAGVGVGLAVGGIRATDPANGSSSGSASEPFYGAHQSGISTGGQAHLVLLSFDLAAGTSATSIAVLLRAWTAEAAALTSGTTTDPSSMILENGPARLTVTVGFGPGVFEIDGLQAERPVGLAPIPAFSHDALKDKWTGGDLIVQIGCDDSVIASYAARRLTDIARSAATIRWRMKGFGPTPGTNPDGATPRNLMGQLDGTANLKVTDQRFDSTVWAGKDDVSWMTGGSYLVVRRIRMLLNKWDGESVAQQETVIGRYKKSGAPLTGQGERDTPDLEAVDSKGEFIIAKNAHIRLANPTVASGARIQRRGFSYDDGIDENGELDAGLIFLAWQADPRRGFLLVQARIDAGDALNEYTRAEGSAIAAVPPGVQPGEFLGSTLFTA